MTTESIGARDHALTCYCTRGGRGRERQRRSAKYPSPFCMFLSIPHIDLAIIFTCGSVTTEQIGHALTCYCTRGGRGRGRQ